MEYFLPIFPVSKTRLPQVWVTFAEGKGTLNMLQKPWKVLPIIMLALAIASVMSVVPARSAVAMPEQAGASHMTQGELVSVDATSQTFTIKQENGVEMQFLYDSNTKVEGKDNGVQGLAAETGSQLTVHYTERSGKKLATQIEIRKQGGQGG
jgi:hypothetical protein